MVFFQPCLLPGMVRLRWFPIFCAMVHGKVSLEEFYCSLRFRQMKVTIVELFDCLSNSWLLSLGVLFFFRNKSDELWITACTAFERLAVSSSQASTSVLPSWKRLPAAKRRRKAPFSGLPTAFVLIQEGMFGMCSVPRISQSTHWISLMILWSQGHLRI